MPIRAYQVRRCFNYCCYRLISLTLSFKIELFKPAFVDLDDWRTLSGCLTILGEGGGAVAGMISGLLFELTRVLSSFIGLEVLTSSSYELVLFGIIMSLEEPKPIII